jgi:hypothetical protein
MFPKLPAIFQLQQWIALHVADHRQHRMCCFGMPGHSLGDLAVIGVEHVAGDQPDQRGSAGSQSPRQYVRDVAKLEGGFLDPVPQKRIDRPSAVSEHAARGADGNTGFAGNVDKRGGAAARGRRGRNIVFGFGAAHGLPLRDWRSSRKSA